MLFSMYGEDFWLFYRVICWIQHQLDMSSDLSKRTLLCLSLLKRLHEAFKTEMQHFALNKLEGFDAGKIH